MESNEGPPSAIITQERNSGIVGDPALSEGTGMTSDSLEDPWYSGQSVPTDTVFAPEPAEADWFPEESAPR